MYRKDNPCIGCQSYTISDGGTCRLVYLSRQKIPLQSLFRDNYCPCKNCVVKIICSDMKCYISTKSDLGDKCKIFKKAINEYNEYIEKKGIRKTVLKRKKKR